MQPAPRNRRNLNRRELLCGTGGAVVAGALGGLVPVAHAGEIEPVAPTAEPDGVVHGRLIPHQSIPFLDCQGTAFECGEMLGGLWKPALMYEAGQAQKSPAPKSAAWWKSPRYAPLVEKYCPHLPDIYRGMAKAAGVPEDSLGEREPQPETPSGCTSFAIAPAATLEGIPISGQNKDVAVSRGRELLVLRMKMTNAPSLLTLTYTGSTWLFGHGFVRGGTALFRNSLYVDRASRGLPYTVWGLLALHCATVDDVIELTNRHGVAEAFHVVVADEHGGILGIENGQGGVAYLRPHEGIYVHGNAVVSEGPLRETERDAGPFRRAESVHRTKRLDERLRADRGRLTAELAYGALCDHDGYPVSVCRHQSAEAHTAAAVIAEPTRGLLHVTHGAPCQNWPQTFALA